MKRQRLTLGIALAAVVAVGLWVGVMRAQEESGKKKQEVSLELVWEKDFDEGIVDVAFDKDRGGLFCPSVIVTGRTDLAVEGVYFLDREGEVVFFRKKRSRRTMARISENGQYVGILDPVKLDGERDPVGPTEIIDRAGKVVSRTPSITGVMFWVSPRGDGIMLHNGYTGEYFFVYPDSQIVVDEAHLDREHRTTFGDDYVAAAWRNTDFSFALAYSRTRTSGQASTAVYSPARGFPLSIISSPDNSWVALALGRGVILFGRESGPKKSIDFETASRVTLSYSPDSRFLLSLSSRGREVIVTDILNNTVLWKHNAGPVSMELPLPQRIDLRWVTGDICNGAKYVAVGERARNCYLFNGTGQLLLKFELPDDSPIASVKLSPEGDFLGVATTGHYDAYRGETLRESSGQVYLYRISEAK